MNSQHEFISKRAQAHAAACAGIASDPLVQAALAQRAADLEVKEAMAQRAAARGRKDDKLMLAVTASAVVVERFTIIRRQAG